MAKKFKKITQRLIKEISPKVETEKVNPVRKFRRNQENKITNRVSNGVKKIKVRVIGIGGGGGNIISEIAQRIKNKVSFFAADTDFKALNSLPRNVEKFQFGKNLTQGLGTGMNPEIAKAAAKNEKERIKQILRGQDFVILIASLGGGVGSGASSIFAKISQNFGNITYGIFTLPFSFEGEKKMEIAKDALRKLRRKLNAFTILPNERIFQIIEKNTPLKKSLSVINKSLADSLQNLIEFISMPGLINIDFADLKTIFEGRGSLAYLNSAEVKGPNQIEELAKKVVSSPLIPYTVQGAKEVLFNIDGGLNLNMSQVEQIGKTISSSINPKARVAFGITQNKKEGIKITLLVNGCKWDEWEQKKEKPKKQPKEKQALITKIQDYNSLAPSRSRSKQASKPKKMVRKKTKEKLPEFPKVQQPEIIQIPTEEPEKVEIKVRKNALEMKESIEKEEKKMITQERKWETPAFLRRKPSQFKEKSKAQ